MPEPIVDLFEDDLDDYDQTLDFVRRSLSELRPPITAADLPRFRYGGGARTAREEFEAFKTAHSTELREKLAACGNKCFYCKVRFELGPNRGKWRTWDHMIPLSRKGLNEVSNLVPCCFSCNNKKRHRTPEEYLAYRTK